MQIYALFVLFFFISTSNASIYCESALNLADESLMFIESSLYSDNMEGLVDGLVNLVYDSRNINNFCEDIVLDAQKPKIHKLKDCDSALLSLYKAMQPQKNQEYQELETISKVLGFIPYLKDNCGINIQTIDENEDNFALSHDQENFEEAEDNGEQTEQALTREERKCHCGR